MEAGKGRKEDEEAHRQAPLHNTGELASVGGAWGIGWEEVTQGLVTGIGDSDYLNHR